MKQRRNETPKKPACSHPEHALVAPIDPASIERAARLFRALGDSPRLTLLQYLATGECCVGEIVTALGEKFPTVSQRLRVLRTEGLVTRRRAGLHVHYSLADGHVEMLLANALAHANELESSAPARCPLAITPKEDER
jgi:ArsR family transcriptional regulator